MPVLRREHVRYDARAGRFVRVRAHTVRTGHAAGDAPAATDRVRAVADLAADLATEALTFRSYARDDLELLLPDLDSLDDALDDEDHAEVSLPVDVPGVGSGELNLIRDPTGAWDITGGDGMFAVGTPDAARVASAVLGLLAEPRSAGPVSQPDPAPDETEPPPDPSATTAPGSAISEEIPMRQVGRFMAGYDAANDHTIVVPRGAYDIVEGGELFGAVFAGNVDPDPGTGVVPGQRPIHHGAIPAHFLVGSAAHQRATLAARSEPAEQVSAALAGSADAAGAHRAAERAAHRPAGSWAANPHIFDAVVQVARERHALGEPAVFFDPYFSLEGSPADREFGVEIEFSDGNQREIGWQLFHSEMIPVPSRVPYHWRRAAGRYSAREERVRWLEERGFDESYDNPEPHHWTYEFDRSVSTEDGGGEVVSPILRARSDEWNRLRRVNEIIRDQNGQDSTAAGFHVHVSLAGFDHTIENHTRLMQEAAAAEDLLFRLGTNPRRGRHRGSSYCYPNETVPPLGYASIEHLRAVNPDHRSAVNVTYVNGDDDDHVEFRMFDATNDPGIQQAQIKVCLAIVSAAARHDTPPPAPRRLGATRDAIAEGTRTPEDDRAEVIAWLDRLFTDEADKAQVASLFAITDWQGQ